jgi:hypothetical protein
MGLLDGRSSWEGSGTAPGRNGQPVPLLKPLSPDVPPAGVPPE